MCVCVCVCPPEHQRVSLHVQVALAGQQVQSEEAVVAPTFTDLKVRRKLPNYVLGWITGGLMDHFHTVLIPTHTHDSITTQGNPIFSHTFGALGNSFSNRLIYLSLT